MKKILIVLTVIMLTACSNEQQQAQRPSKSTATEKKEIPPTKVLVVDQSCKKIEVSLYKGNNIVVFEGSSDMEKLKDKRALDRVTVYRIWKENDPTDWKIDMASPQSMDTIQIFLDGTSLRKLEYRQGYIYSIYK